MRSLRVTGAVVAAVAIVPLLAVPAAATATGYTGVVSDDTGQPVAGACLALLRTETEVQGTFCTDAAGRYAITGVPTGVGYRVRVAAAGYRTHWWPDAPDHLNAEAVYLPDAELVQRHVTLGRGAGTIRGRIVDESGAPAEATVSLWAADRDWRALAYVTPSGDGRYEVANLAPGHYQVAVFDEVHGTQWVPGRESRGAAAAYPVADGQELVVDERWLDLGAVEVRVTDEETGASVPRPCALLETALRTLRQCGSDGVVRLDQVPPGRWEVALTAAPSHFPPARPIPVEVARGLLAPLAVRLTPGAGVTTTVLDRATRTPVGRVCVRLVAPRWGGQSTNQGGYCSDEQGRLAIGPLPGPSTVQLYAYQARDPYDPPPVRYGAQWVTATGGSGDQRAASTVAIGTGATTAIPPILLDPPGAIGGVISDAATGAPVAGVCAYPYAFRPDHGSDFGRHCSAADGRYTIDDLGPYRWPVEFAPDPASGYAWQWSGDVPDRFAATLTRVRTGGTATAHARLVGGGTLTGTVTRDGRPVDAGSVLTYHRRTGDVAGASVGYLRPGGGFTVPGHRTQEVFVQYRDPADTCWYGEPPGRSGAAGASDAAGGPAAATPVPLTAGGTTTLAMDLVTTCAPVPGPA